MQAEASAGYPQSLGATLDSTGANFAYPAPGAEAVFVCVFDDADREIARIRLPGRKTKPKIKKLKVKKLN